MSTELSGQVGITDPTLQWVAQAEALHSAPGIDPIEALQSQAEITPKDGYLIAATVHLGTGIASTRIHVFAGGQLRLHDRIDPSNMYGVGHATAEFAKPGFCTTVMCGGLEDSFSEYDDPGHGEFVSGKASVAAVDGTGYFVAATKPHTTYAGQHYVKSYNALSDPKYGAPYTGYKPAQLARVVSSREAALKVAAAIGQGAGLDELQQALYAAKVNEQLALLDGAQRDRTRAERQLAERGRFATYIADMLGRRFGVRLTDRA